MNPKYVSLIVVLSCSLTSGLFAQHQSVIHDGSRPGGYFNGRYIGFVPKHEKIANQTACAAYLEAIIPPLNRRVDDEHHVRPVSVTTELDAVPHVAEDGEYLYDESVVYDGHGETISDHHPNLLVSETPLIWARIEYLHWWMKGMQTPPLVTTSLDGTPQAEAGVLGLDSTSVLWGDSPVNADGRSGGRLSFGRWIDPTCGQSWDVSFTALSEESDTFGGSGANHSILARPFFNVLDGQQDARLIVYPGLLEGTMSVSSATEFHTLEAVFRQIYAELPGIRADYSFGYRYADLNDHLRINENTISLSGPTIGSTFSLFDSFETENEFHGGQFGLRILTQKNDCWTFEWSALLALGNTRSTATINGQTTATPRDGSSTTTNVGLLARESNIGEYRLNKFSGIAELGVNVRRQFACGWTARFGYTAFFWSDVLRAGDQIDLNVNPSQDSTGQTSSEIAPVFPGETGSFWAQGMNLGLEYSF